MSSGALKDLIKVIAITAPELSLPLPIVLQEVLTAYLEKLKLDDDLESENLQDELLTVYQDIIVGFPSSLAAFLAVLRRLRFVLRGSTKLVQWWQQLLYPILKHLDVEPGLADGMKNTLIDILVYNEDEVKEKQWIDLESNSTALSEILIATWQAKTTQADEENDDYAGFVAQHIQSILVEYGKRRPQHFLTVLNEFFVQIDSRILSLSLLSNFFRYPSPHLDHMLSTPLFSNLLSCLQLDTSTRAVSLAMTILVMFLPHIPSVTSQYLPALFNIYTRLLFWDRVRKLEELPSPKLEEAISGTRKTGWIKLHSLFDSDNDSVPELLHYFTFLYGLYPINFMSYIRKPQKYLRNAKNYLGVAFNIEPKEVWQRSEPFRQVHLLHPNFFTFTIKSELTGNNRWIKSDATDVVAKCMALYIPSEDSYEEMQESKSMRIELENTNETRNYDEVTSSQTALYDSRFQDRPDDPNSRQMRISLPSLSHEIRQDDASLKLSGKISTPVVISRDMPSVSLRRRLTGVLSSITPQKSHVLRAVSNNPNDSIRLHHHQKSPESYDSDHLSSPNKFEFSRSPFFQARPKGSLNSDIRLAYLYRETQLLRNDLNFERYLNQQHLSHIGHLRRKQIREARIEAETQNFITSNFNLKLKMKELRRLNTQLKEECEKSKVYSVKLEVDLIAKLGMLREEQKKWTAEREILMQDLDFARNEQAAMQQIILGLEASELKEKQKVIDVESSLAELERLRTEVKFLNTRVRIHGANEQVTNITNDNLKKSEARVIILEAELYAREKELRDAKQAFRQEISNIWKEAQKADINQEQENNAGKEATQDMIDSALGISRARILELQKSYSQLQGRYVALQERYYGSKD